MCKYGKTEGWRENKCAKQWKMHQQQGIQNEQCKGCRHIVKTDNQSTASMDNYQKRRGSIFEAEASGEGRTRKADIQYGEEQKADQKSGTTSMEK